MNNEERLQLLQKEYDEARKNLKDIKSKIKEEGFLIKSHKIQSNEEKWYIQWDFKSYSHKNDHEVYFQVDKGYQIIGDWQDLTFDHLMELTVGYSDLMSGVKDNTTFTVEDIKNNKDEMDNLGYWDEAFNNNPELKKAYEKLKSEKDIVQLLAEGYTSMSHWIDLVESCHHDRYDDYFEHGWFHIGKNPMSYIHKLPNYSKTIRES